MSLRAVFVLCLAVGSLGLRAVGPAHAADECNGLRVCLPVTGPWVVVPAGGVDYELACPVAGYVIGGTDARVAAKDVDVSFRGETGSPVGPGVTTRHSVVFHARRARLAAEPTSFEPFIGCIPTSGGGGRAQTGVKAPPAGSKPSQPLFSVVRSTPIRRPAQTVRVACPTPSELVGSTHAVAFRQSQPPTTAQRAAIRVRRGVVEGVVVARVATAAAAGPRAEVQVRVVCAKRIR